MSKLGLGRLTFTAGNASGPHYQAEVNKRSLHMESFTQVLNARWSNGYRLADMIEQDGNTVVVWEKAATT